VALLLTLLLKEKPLRRTLGTAEPAEQSAEARSPAAALSPH